jgi:hypothetical protein
VKGQEMDQGQMRLAGWLSIINAVLTIPLAVISFALGTRSGQESQVISVILTVASAFLFTYIMSSLKSLLGQCYRFHETDGLITALIVLNVVLAVVSILGEIIAPLKTTIAWLLVISIVPLGVIFIVFAIKLLRLQDNLYGMLKPFSYLSIATGVCFATIVLLPLGLLTSIVTDILLGMIFFRVAEG